MIRYEDLSSGDVDVCRELCNELMELQAARSRRYRAALEYMNFDNRLKPAFESAAEKFLYVAFDGTEQAVSNAKYIFVHVSNGNDAGALYEKYGFQYSHSMFDGMIGAYWLKLEITK